MQGIYIHFFRYSVYLHVELKKEDKKAGLKKKKGSCDLLLSERVKKKKKKRRSYQIILNKTHILSTSVSRIISLG